MGDSAQTKPIVVIVGRPNVGKSTLFNRLTKKRLAIVEDVPGITRDRLYADVEWNGREFTLVDTGGLQFGESHGLVEQICRQVRLAIEEADLVIFLVDAREGLAHADREAAQILRRAGKPVLLVANKAEANLEQAAYEFYALGLGEPLCVSAEQGINIGELLDRVVEGLPEYRPEVEPREALRVAVVGRPNVGKSTLVNALLGEERVIVDDQPGTTRDAVDVVCRYDDRLFVLIDTAGMRRKARIETSVERYSVLRALRAVDRSDVVLVLLDAMEGITQQDQRIAGYVHEAGRASIMVVNKWDLVEDKEGIAEEYLKAIRYHLPFMDYAPVIFVSAKTGRRVGKIFALALKVADQYGLRLPTGDLNRLIREAIYRSPPPGEAGRPLKIYYVTQPSTRPPTFVFFVNDPDLVHFSYRRYLENQLREAYGFEGTPLRLIFRKRR